MRNNTVWLIVIILLILVALFVALPIEHPSWLEKALPGSSAEAPRDLHDLELGLDLRGGTQVLLEAMPAEGQDLDEGAMGTAKLIVENRVNGLGVAEANVQQQGEDRIIVELPGVDNPDQAVETIRSTGQLEFVDPGDALLSDGMIINTTYRPTAAQSALEGIAAGTVDPAAIPYPDQLFETVMTGDILRNALPTQGQYGQWEIGFELTNAGSDEFFNYTRDHVGRPLAIVLDGLVLSAPTIQAAISDSGVINGQFTRDEADSLAVQMRYGALPVPLEVVDINTIGAQLGQASVDASVQAGIIGLVAVLLFMLLLYRLPGVVADLALAAYVLFNLAVYKLIPVTLTLPGIAGFLLSIGMAVDANILILERMKEELRVGRSLRLAVEAGFSRAWPAIRDGNLTTLISCAVLFWFGNTFGASIVKGFAFTLAIGVLLSMFTAMVVTRIFMRTIMGSVGQKMLESRLLRGF